VAYVVSSRRGQELATTAISLPMRGLVEGLETPHPLAERLPSVLQEDEFCCRMVAAFDEVLAPIFNTLDCFDSYLDPALAPDDFVDWLASWVGVEIDETWTLERRRRLLMEAVDLYRVRGTANGLADHIALYAGVRPEIQDSGGCAWSQSADGALPGSPDPRVLVRLHVEDENSVRRTTVSRIVDAARPAHVPYQLEIVVGGTAVPSVAEAPKEAAAPDAPGAVALPGSEHIELAPQGPDAVEEAEGEGVASDTDQTPQAESTSPADPPAKAPRATKSPQAKGDSPPAAKAGDDAKPPAGENPTD
jgi:phage tail-like protein